MAIYKNWTKIAELDDDKNFLKLRLMVEDNQEKLAEFQKLYPELFCNEPVSLRCPKSLIIEATKKYYIENMKLISGDLDEDDLENANNYSEDFWEKGCEMLCIPIINLNADHLNFWFKNELYEDIDLFEFLEKEDFKPGFKIKIFNKEMIIVDYNPLGKDYDFTLALDEHIDMNS